MTAHIEIGDVYKYPRCPKCGANVLTVAITYDGKDMSAWATGGGKCPRCGVMANTELEDE